MNKLHAEVRFHLQAGEHYRKWQVKVMNGRKKVDVYYYNPSDYQLELRGCKLINKLSKARKVNAAGVKDVAGWVECEEVILNKKDEYPVDHLEKLYYNPIRDVHWRRESDSNEYQWDNSEYATLITEDRQVYILEERT